MISGENSSFQNLISQPNSSISSELSCVSFAFLSCWGGGHICLSMLHDKTYVAKIVLIFKELNFWVVASETSHLLNIVPNLFDPNT